MIQQSQSDFEEAQKWANLCEEFQRLRSEDNLSKRQAARALGLSPSQFSGENSMLARYKRGGLAALLPARRAPANISELTKQIEALPWFIPAARFFYLLTNRNYFSGSVPEALRRVISLPNLPKGWDYKVKARFAKLLGITGENDWPIFPPELREEILSRQKDGKPMVPERIAKKITVNPATVRQYRNPTNAALDYLNSPGGMRLFTEDSGHARLARAGEIMEADDATINFPVCVPWRNGGDKCSAKFGVRVGRFQWLVAIDAGTSYITGYNYTMRPRSSYRAEDVVSLMRAVCSDHGIPRRWRLERGVWKSNLVVNAVKNLGSNLDTVYSPHQKPFIEGLFNTLWTKLSVHFPAAHVGRFMGEHERANNLLTACQDGREDPRKHFPMLADALAAFDEVVAEKNRTPVNSEYHGRWVPAERWHEEIKQPRLDPAAEWMFYPFVKNWTVRGMLVGGRVPMFEELSVPFDFTAPWLPQYHGQEVRCHFDPRTPKGLAKIVLASSGKILGDAEPLSDTAGYIRFVMGWERHAGMEGPRARQQAAAAMRREVRGVVPNGKGYFQSEERDGIATITKIENGRSKSPRATERPAPETALPEITFDRAARQREQQEFERNNQHLFA